MKGKMIGSWFPQIWSIFDRKKQVETLVIKKAKRNDIKLDGRKTRQIRYWFEKQYIPKGWSYWFIKKV